MATRMGSRMAGLGGGPPGPVRRPTAPGGPSDRPSTFDGNEGVDLIAPEKEWRVTRSNDARRPISGSWPGRTSSEGGGERTVGDTDTYVDRYVRIKRGDSRSDESGKGGVAPKVSRRTASGELKMAGADDLHSRGEGVDQRRHRFEQTGIAGRIVVDDFQLRTTALGLPSTHSSAHPVGSRPGRRRHHPVGPKHRHRRVGRRICATNGGNNGPIRTPHGENAGRDGAHNSSSETFPTSTVGSTSTNDRLRRRADAPRPSASTSTLHADR